MGTRVAETAFVGREPELAALDALVGALGSSEPSGVTVALIGGDAGIGKTRFVTEVARRHPDVTTVVGGCVEVSLSLPYAAVVESLDRLVSALGVDEARRLAGPARSRLAALVPRLGTADAVVGTAEGPTRLFNDVRAFLAAVGETRRLVVVLEDLHWADHSTLDLVAFLARSLDSDGVLLVATYRTDELHRRHPLRPLLAELGRHQRVATVALAPLDVGELRSLLEQASEGPLSIDRIESIAARSEGNAFYAEELLAASASGRALPEGLRDLLLLRLDRVGEDTAQVVRVASVAGRMVPHALLAQVAGVAPEQLDSCLREAIEHGLLVTDGEGYRFRHALQREAVVEELLPGERTSLHRAYAAALVADPDLAVSRLGVDAELVHHHTAAHDNEAAFRAAVSAARRAEAAFADREALDLAEQALALWDVVDDETRGEVSHLDLLLLATRASFPASEFRRGVEHANAAVAATRPGTPERADTLTWRSLYEWVLAESAVARATMVEALEEHPPRDDAVSARMLSWFARILALRGESEEAAEVAERAVTAARAAGHRAYEGQALNSLGVAISSHDPEAAVGLCREALAIAQETGGIDDQVRGYVNLVSVLDSAGRREESIETAEEGLAWARQMHLPPPVYAFLTLNRVSAFLDSGRLADAEAAMAEADHRTSDVAEIYLHLCRVRLHLLRGEVEQAERGLARVHAMTEHTAEPQFLGPIAHFEIVLGWETGDIERVRTAVASRPMDTRDGWVGLKVLEALAVAARAEADAATAARVRGDAETAARSVAALERHVRAGRATLEASPGSLVAEVLAATVDAELTVARGDAPEVRVEAWERAVALGQRDPELLPFDDLLARWRLAEALVLADERDRATAVLAAAHADAARMGFGAVTGRCLDLARRARLAVGTEAPSGDDAVPELTPREAEVLLLVAEGRTNKQIGEALFISPKTASVHVSNILAKLGAANRSEAGAIAHRLGLTV